MGMVLNCSVLFPNVGPGLCRLVLELQLKFLSTCEALGFWNNRRSQWPVLSWASIIVFWVKVYGWHSASTYWTAFWRSYLKRLYAQQLFAIVFLTSIGFYRYYSLLFHCSRFSCCHIYFVKYDENALWSFSSNNLLDKTKRKQSKQKAHKVSW